MNLLNVERDRKSKDAGTLVRSCRQSKGNRPPAADCPLVSEYCVIIALELLSFPLPNEY